MAKKSTVVSTSDSSAKKSSSKRNIIIVVTVLIIALLGVGAYFAYDYVQDQNEKIERLSDPQQAAKDEATRVKDLVARLADIPTDESPTIATVSDSSKLKSQAFFKNAENGDKVLIFTKAKKAYLYRPSTDKLIEVAPVNIGNNEKSNSGQDATKPATQ